MQARVRLPRLAMIPDEQGRKKLRERTAASTAQGEVAEVRFDGPSVPQIPRLGSSKVVTMRLDGVWRGDTERRALSRSGRVFVLGIWQNDPD